MITSVLKIDPAQKDILDSGEINDLAGTLYLDSYDENNSNPMYSFIKD